ncbi:3-hydroxyacyl-ACP dehydratase FabZ [soil metagenome]
MITLQEALQSLPHGDEFRFVESLDTLNPGVSATGSYLLRGDEVFLRGHFPGQPLMPAVLLVEAMAQVAGIAAQTDEVIPAMCNLRLTAIRSVKVYGAILPGERMEIEAEVLGRMGNLVLASGRVTVEGRLLAEGQITLSGDA